MKPSGNIIAAEFALGVLSPSEGRLVDDIAALFPEMAQSIGVWCLHMAPFPDTSPAPAPPPNLCAEAITAPDTPPRFPNKGNGRAKAVAKSKKGSPKRTRRPGSPRRSARRPGHLPKAARV